ncbi:MAG: hypothetical protein P0Y58_22405 [Candidatus Pseudomonas phytovorans]|uniref:Uncharacterized protein n=1 Tax=Candidatus Pseudomonas phytovorans TaxID=3121377 RepID=A0AAJ5WEU3_9PSED|nr:hypothetical protein [Pseudomonas sp.]WEK29619.1 MAG: hypothetical protein P0Y58_22405 [Pseudomonas sp.]
MQDDYKTQLTKATEGLHYCDLILTAQEAEDLRALVQELQGAGRYPGLSGVFRTILEETWCSDEPWPTISSPATPRLD